MQDSFSLIELTTVVACYHKRFSNPVVLFKSLDSLSNGDEATFQERSDFEPHLTFSPASTSRKVQCLFESGGLSRLVNYQCRSQDVLSALSKTRVSEKSHMTFNLVVATIISSVGIG